MKPMTKFSQFICTEESRSESKFYKKICKTDVEQLLISHFLRNSTSESAAAFLPHVRLGLYFIRQRCDTDSNVEFLACRILFMHYFNVMSMHKFGPAKKKEQIWPFSSQCNLSILQNKLLHCPAFTISSPSSIGG